MSVKVFRALASGLFVSYTIRFFDGGHYYFFGEISSWLVYRLWNLKSDSEYWPWPEVIPSELMITPSLILDSRDGNFIFFLKLVTGVLFTSVAFPYDVSHLSVFLTSRSTTLKTNINRAFAGISAIFLLCQGKRFCAVFKKSLGSSWTILCPTCSLSLSSSYNSCYA